MKGAYFVGGACVGAGLLVVFAGSAGKGWKNDIEEKAVTYRNAGADLNALFEKSGKGLLSIKVAGRTCVIDVDRNIFQSGKTYRDGNTRFSSTSNHAQSGLFWMACVNNP